MHLVSREYLAVDYHKGHSMQQLRPILPETGFLRLPQVLAVFPIGRSSWWAGVRSGKYPAPFKLGPRTTAWRVEDIRGLIARVAA